MGIRDVFDGTTATTNVLEVHNDSSLKCSENAAILYHVCAHFIL